MAAPEQSLTDPLTLLPTVLDHLTSLQKKPSLASSVFATVRKAFRTSKAQPLVTPLLPPLTAIALTSPLENVRLDAASTCAALLRGQVSRRVSPLATAYVADLVALAHSLINDTGIAPLPCELPRYAEVAKNTTNYNIATETNTVTLAIAPESLEALFQLLSQFVPATESQLTRHASGNQGIYHAVSTRLWVCIGTTARAALLDIAASYAVLSGRCGEGPSRAAANLLESALDHASICAVPTSTRESICATVEAVLCESFPSSNDDTSKRRAALYRVAQLSSTEGALSAELWTSCGIREAAIAGTLGEQLMKFSNQGKVQPYFCDTDEDRKECRSNREPPKKKRRRSQYHNESSLDGKENSGAESSQIPSVNASQRAIAGLQRTLQSLESIYVCTEDASCMRLLGKACVLTADSLDVISRDRTSCSKSLVEWITFGSSLSLIVRDLSMGLRADAKQDVWEATIEFSQATIRLVEGLHSVKSMVSGIHGNRKISDADPVITASNNLLVGLTNILGTAIHALKAVKEFPVIALGDLSFNLGELALAKGIAPLEEESFATACGRLQDISLEGGSFDGTSQAALIRGSSHVFFATSKPFAAQQGMKAFPMLTSLLAANVTAAPDIMAAAACSLADTLCTIVGCRDVHGSPVVQNSGFEKESLLLETELWTNCFEAIVPCLDGAAGSKVLIGTLKCFGSLALHSPPEKISQCVSLLLDTLWLHDIQEAQDLTYFHLRDMLKNRVDVRTVLLKEPFQNVPGPSSGMFQTSDIHQLQEGNENEDFVCILLRDVAKRVAKWDQEQDRHMERNASRDAYPMGLIMRLASEVMTSPKLAGLTIYNLLSASLAEFSSFKGIPSSRPASQEHAKHTSVARGHSVLIIWLSMLRAISLHSGHLERVAKEKNDRLFDRRRGPVHSANTSSTGPQTFAQVVTTFLTSRFREWLPHALPKMLNDPSFASLLANLLTDGDIKALWVKIPRHTMEVLLKDRNMTELDKLASNVNQPHSALVEKACADALASAVMSQEGEIDTSPTGSNAFILNLLQQPLESIISKRAGKIVQKLVMEFGTCQEPRAKRGLVSLSKLLNASESSDSSPGSVAGSLLSQHFMLVMDAVNRGLFHSKATCADRLRYLRMLEVVISMASMQLHLFVPKILATLKLALDMQRGNDGFRSQTLKVWIGFLKTLGSNRMIPHLGSILSTLLPFYDTYNRILAPSLNSLVEKCAGQQMNNRRDIVLLLQVTDHEDLKKSANILEASANGIPAVRRTSTAQPRMTVKDLSLLARSVGSVIVHLENGTIEVLCARHLLWMLRRSRDQLCSAATALGKYQDLKPSEEVVALASISGALVDLLTRTKNAKCQEVLMQCIGEIGAIDPALVCEMYKGVIEKEEHEVLALNMQYPRSVHALVALLLDNFLIPTLTKGEQQDRSSSRQNRVGLVIQELLRVCGCEKDTAKRASKTLRSRRPGDGIVEWDKVLVGETEDENAIFFWENLLTTTRNVAEPYLAEPFDVKHYRAVFGESAAGNTKLACQPVWARVKTVSPAGLIPTAQEWRRQMIVQLVDFIGKQGGFGEVLKALRPVLRYEDDVAAFIFPLVVATALDIQQGNESNKVPQFLRNEIAQVLQDGSSPQPLFDLFDTLRHWRDQRCTEQARMTRMTNPGLLKNSNGAISSRRKVPLEAYVELEKDQDPLSAFVDLNGRESTSLSLCLQARSAFRAKSYSRAIMMAETHIRNTRSKRGFAGWPSFIEDVLGKDRATTDSRVLCESESLRLLQKAFAELEDAENMTGIAALRGTSSLTEQVIDCEAAGRYDEALTTYERAIASQSHSIAFHEGFLGCLMTLGHWESMLSHAKGLLSSSNLSEKELRETAKANGIAAAWRLGRWAEMEDFHRNSFNAAKAEDSKQLARSWALKFSLSLGEMFLSLRSGRFASLHQAANEARRHILSSTVKAAREGYGRAYPMVALLHSLSDIEDSCRVLEHAVDELPQEDETKSMRDISSERLVSFSSRIEASKSSLKAREPLISVRRVCYELLQKPNDAARANLELALLAREGSNFHAASASAYRAMSTDSIDNHVRNATVVEMARIRRAQGDCSVALKTVKGEIERLTSVLEQGQREDYQVEFVRETSDRLCTALVLAGSWIEETRGEPSEVILSCFQRAAAYSPSREEPFYSLGRHYDSLLQASANSDEKTSQVSDLSSGRASRRSGGQSDSEAPHHSIYVPLVISSFAKALVNGHTRIFEALPRMLTVWFDYHTELDDPNAGSAALTVESDVKQEMKKAFECIPGYMWMTAVPQIMSRILHPRKQVREDLTNLLAKLVCVFPDQCFWTILPSSQLKSTERKRAAGSILNHAMAMTKRKGRGAEGKEKVRILRSRIQSALSVVTSFVGICSNLLPKEKRGRRENCSREFMELKSYLRTNMAMNPIIPTLDSLTTRLPYGEAEEHRPFDTEPVRIVDIEDYVLVMVSLMRPRRIGLVGSDGRSYRYLAKKENQGDMRKDSRLVELITVVNRLLTKNTSSRDTKLALKTYAVLPLSEETGMIEWVNDLAPLRNVVRDEHNRLSMIPDTQQIQSKYQTMASHKKFLVEWAFVKLPPVLDKFFLHRFGQVANAEAWLAARNLWTESTAVWSMVGYVVGLGDRHGENVLLETTSGRCVHVDFAMLFDKGLKLKVPEIVPFRLTRNMVTAMGIAGYEGVYRAVSESVLDIMRRNADAVLGVLESFLHDPLADWGRNEARVNKGGILATKEAWQTRAAVKAKLTGMVDNSGLPLSIKGQVQRLIHEATSIDNLSEMYLWWSAWV